MVFQSWHGICIGKYIDFGPDGPTPITRMNDMQITKTLTIGLIVALSLAVATARAGESADSEIPCKANEVSTGMEKEIAADAIKAAADEAARSVLKETRLDLDIRLIGPTSPRIAGRK